jgi:hypothetical protein
MLVAVLDTPRPSRYTSRQIACFSLLAGNGVSWATKQCARARQTGVRSDRPTVADAMRAEERAIGQMRKRVAKDCEDARARARSFFETTAH